MTDDELIALAERLEASRRLTWGDREEAAAAIRQLVEERREWTAINRLDRP